MIAAVLAQLAIPVVSGIAVQVVNILAILVLLVPLYQKVVFSGDRRLIRRSTWATLPAVIIGAALHGVGPR